MLSFPPSLHVLMSYDLMSGLIHYYCFINTKANLFVQFCFSFCFSRSSRRLSLQLETKQFVSLTFPVTFWYHLASGGILFSQNFNIFWKSEYICVFAPPLCCIVRILTIWNMGETQIVNNMKECSQIRPKNFIKPHYCILYSDTDLNIQIPLSVQDKHKNYRYRYKIPY